MQITSRFTIAVHVLTCIEYFSDIEKVTSNFLAGSIGVNPVIIRTVMGGLKEAGMIESSQGKSGITLAKKLDEISFYDVYKAIDNGHEGGIFNFHDNPNPDCPVGANIHKAMDERLLQVQNAMEAEMRKISVADVAADIHKAVE